MKLYKRLMVGGAAIFLVGSLAPTAPASGPTLESSWPAASSSDNPCYNFKSAEKEFASLMNKERSNKGKSTMRLDPEISKVARKHTKEMINKNLLHHTPSTTLANRVTAWTTLGENVGVGGTVESLHDAFMNSTAHRDNVLHDSFKYVGVGSKEANGRLWVTVIFEASSNPGTTLGMPRC